MVHKNKRKKKSNNCRIMLIPPQELPIPAVGGGAIETLITNLLDENEKEKKFRFIVISTTDSEAQKIQYSNSHIYYFDSEKEKGWFFNYSRIKFLFLRMKNLVKRAIRKIGIIPSWNTEIIYPDFFYYQCLQIAKKEKVGIIISEGDWNTKEYRIFYDLVGKDNIFYHLHCEIKENLEVRKSIPNSIAISDYVKNQWVKNEEIKGENIVIHNCIDINRFTSDIHEEKRKQIREKNGICEEEMLVIFCGRLIPEKGIDKLLDAFDLLIEQPIKLIVIGSTNFSKGNSTEFSKEIVARINKMASVKYLGYIPNEEMPVYYKASDIQVIPSVWQEGAGLVAIEGMASGLPLIITNSGGMVEYVTDECALIIPIDNDLPKNIARNIFKLYKDGELRKRMRNAGKERAKNFTKQQYYQKFVNAFENR